MTSLVPRLMVGLLLCVVVPAEAQTADPPQVGAVEFLPLDQVTPGMAATAWTTFEGGTAEALPVEIVGILRNVWGPGQHIIMAKLGGKAARTNVAAGMSGSPVYHNGKLLGAISLRFSTFSPDAVAGITPIELMLEISEFDQGRPLLAGAQGGAAAADASSDDVETALVSEPGLADQIWASQNASAPPDSYMNPIETPLSFSGVPDGVLDVFRGYFRKAGVLVMQGGATGASAAASSTLSSKGALLPGEPVAAVMISGDTAASGLGTVTYNDGKRVLAFGHAMFNMGPVEMPMAKADVLMVLASQLRPVKIANSTEIVGALRQDRHSGIMGILGETAAMIPVRVKVKTFGEGQRVIREKELNYNIFQNQKLTPPLMVFTLYNSMFGLNDFAQESTFRLMGEIELDGERRISLETMRAASDAPIPAPLLLAGWVGDKFQKLFANTGELPRFKEVNVAIELLPDRRVIEVEQAWVGKSKVRPGDELEGKVLLRPYRGERIEKPFRVTIPSSAPKGTLRLMVSDAAVLNRGKRIAVVRNRLMSLSETVSLLNQEHTNNRLYISLLQPGVTAHFDDKTLPNLPLSVLNVMRQSAKRRMLLEGQSPLSQTSIHFDSIVSGNYTINLQVM